MTVIELILGKGHSFSGILICVTFYCVLKWKNSCSVVVPEIQLIGFCAQISSCQFASQRVNAYWPFSFVVGTYVVT